MLTNPADTPLPHIFRLPRQFDALAVKQLRATFDGLAGSDHREIQLNFHDVEFIDSSAIGAVVFLYKRLKARNATLSISRAGGQPRELMQYLRIDKTIAFIAADVSPLKSNVGSK